MKKRKELKISVNKRNLSLVITLKADRKKRGESKWRKNKEKLLIGRKKKERKDSNIKQKGGRKEDSLWQDGKEKEVSFQEVSKEARVTEMNPEEEKEN